MPICLPTFPSFGWAEDMGVSFLSLIPATVILALSRNRDDSLACGEQSAKLEVQSSH